MLDDMPHDTHDAIGARNEDGRIVISLVGEIEGANADAVTQAFDAATHAAPMPVVFDIADVEFLDSSFLRSIVVCQQRLAEHGVSVTVRNPTEQARKVFEITALRELLE